MLVVGSSFWVSVPGKILILAFLLRFIMLYSIANSISFAMLSQLVCCSVVSVFYVKWEVNLTTIVW